MWLNLLYSFCLHIQHAVSPHFGLRTKRYKLVRFYKRVSSWELYDLQKDPNEMHNLYGQKKYEKITAQMKLELSKLIAQYEDQDAGKIVADN